MIETEALVKKRVLREEIKNHLADAIMNKELKPGDRIIEMSIAKKYGVSQAPVREALRDLEKMGIVVTENYKGTYVRELTITDLKNVYEVRAELEGLAIRRVAANPTPFLIEQLQKIYQEMLLESLKGDTKKQILIDIDFHRLIVKASKNDILERTWETLSIPHWTFFGIYLLRKEREDLVVRHEPIIQAIKDRDPKEAERLMRNHFLELKESLHEIK